MKIRITAIVVLFATFVDAQESKTDTIVNTKEIQEVLIKSQRKKQFSDHSNYTFEKEALEKARHSKDLLTTLPELQIDPISNTISSIKGGRLLFLINGIEASDNQIKSIAPTNVVRVEYYDIPTAKYAQRADTVVNIITRNPEVGYSYGVDVNSALTTGFVNGSAYAGYTKGKNDFGLEYSINLRDYDNRVVQKIYEYDLNNTHYQSIENRKDHFGYTDQDITLRYARVVSEKYTFQSKFSINPYTYFSNSEGQSLLSQNSSTQTDGTTHHSSTNYTNPTLDLYYSKMIGTKDELSLNLIGSHYTTKSSQLDHEWNLIDNSDVFNNSMNLKANQTGIVGELAYVHTYEKGKLSSGYRLSNTSISNDLVNLLGASKYSVNYLEQYLYSEYSGKKDKLTYRFGIGVTNIQNKSSEQNSNYWAPNPKLVLGYEIGKNQTLRFKSDYTLNTPSASALSSNIVQIVPNIVQYGNPKLKPYGLIYNSLQYAYNKKYADFTVTVFHNYLRDGYNQYYVRTENGFGLTYQNADFVRNFGGQFSGSIKPFGSSLLVLKVFLMPVSIKVKQESGNIIKNTYLRNSFTLSSEYKSFNIQYQLSIPVYSLNGAVLNTSENQNHIFAGYQFKDWRFSTGMYWLGTPSEYKTKTPSESEIHYKAHTQIFNNKNMLVMGISYDFSSGKKLQIQKKLNNNTAPAVTF